MKVQDYHPAERAALIAVSLSKGAYLTTEDLKNRYNISLVAARRDFQRLSRVLPIDYRQVPARRGNQYQWFWVNT